MALEDLVWKQLQEALDTVYNHVRKSDRVAMWEFAEEYIKRAKQREQR